MNTATKIIEYDAPDLGKVESLDKERIKEDESINGWEYLDWSFEMVATDDENYFAIKFIFTKNL